MIDSKSKKSVLITGGSRGIGAACVEKFVSMGWNVAFTYNHNEEAADKLIDKLTRIAQTGGDLDVHPNAHPGILKVKLDLSMVSSDASSYGIYNEKKIEEVFNAVRTYFGIGAFDAVVINAGISRSGPIDGMTAEDIDELIDVNLRGAIYTARAAVPGMVAKKSGSIVLISSIWGRTGASCESVYSATKAGIEGFGRSLAKELGPSGIRVNVASPGVIDTEMNSGYTKDELSELCFRTPLGRLGKPEEVAEAVYFLADDERSSFVTGQVIGIDGGFTE